MIALRCCYDCLALHSTTPEGSRRYIMSVRGDVANTRRKGNGFNYADMIFPTISHTRQRGAFVWSHFLGSGVTASVVLGWFVYS